MRVRETPSIMRYLPTYALHNPEATLEFIDITSLEEDAENMHAPNQWKDVNFGGVFDDRLIQGSDTFEVGDAEVH